MNRESLYAFTTALYPSASSKLSRSAALAGFILMSQPSPYGSIGTKKVPLSQANAIQHIISGYVGGHPTPNIRSERQDSHRFWNSGRSYRPTCHAIVFQKETEDGALQ